MPSNDALVASSFLLLVVRQGATSSVLGPSSSNALVASRGTLVTSNHALILVVRPSATSSALGPSRHALVTSSDALVTSNDALVTSAS